MKRLALIKIGGGLITDKSKPFTVREDMMHAAAEGIRRLVEKYPDMSIVVGNGAGSFGHFLATKYATTESAKMEQQHVEEIHESVVKLNTLFVKHLRDADMEAVSVSPASFITCRDGVVTQMSVEKIAAALVEKKIPVIFGDIVPDETRGGTILSTESLFELILGRLKPEYEDTTLVYAGNTDGVWDENKKTIPKISSASWQDIQKSTDSLSGFDVTGGMHHKVESALRVAHFAKRVYIVSGKDPEAIVGSIENKSGGTRVVA